MVRAYEEASGNRLRVERLGSLDDLDRRIADLQTGGPPHPPLDLDALPGAQQTDS